MNDYPSYASTKFQVGDRTVVVEAYPHEGVDVSPGIAICVYREGTDPKVISLPDEHSLGRLVDAILDVWQQAEDL